MNILNRKRFRGFLTLQSRRIIQRLGLQSDDAYIYIEYCKYNIV